VAAPRWLKALVSWFSHHISRGLSAVAAMAQAADRFPDFTQDRLSEALRLAQIATQSAARANRLSVSAPLREALAGAPEPEPNVEVRVLVSYRDAAGGRDDFSFRVEAFWGDTLGSLLDQIEGAIRSRLARSPGLEVMSVDIIAPLLFGR
jgi:hypothetical protein